MNFTYEKPTTLPEAIALYAANSGRFPILAGGTDIIVQWRSGAINLEGLIDISGIGDLRTIEASDDAVNIGTLVTHSSIISHPTICEHVPALAKASATIGALQVQNRGTIGGNIMNASPAGDTLPVLIACDAMFLAQDLRGERWIPAKDMYIGYRKTSLATGEILTRISIPKKKKMEVIRFYKVGTRRAQAISKVSLCVRATIQHGGIESITIAVGSAAPTIVRALGTETLLTGRAINSALIDQARYSLEDEISPIDDVRSTAKYRRFVAGSLLARFLREATVGNKS